MLGKNVGSGYEYPGGSHLGKRTVPVEDRGAGFRPVRRAEADDLRVMVLWSYDDWITQGIGV